MLTHTLEKQDLLAIDGPLLHALKASPDGVLCVRLLSAKHGRVKLGLWVSEGGKQIAPPRVGLTRTPPTA